MSGNWFYGISRWQHLESYEVGRMGNGYVPKLPAISDPAPPRESNSI